jgi:hypothetical protein
LLFVLAIVAQGCSGAAFQPANDAGPSDALPPAATRTLRFLVTDPQELEPRAVVPIRVELREQGVLVDGEVRFALVGSALDGSITPTRVNSSNGVAAATLTAPSNAAALSLRASSDGATDVFLRVSVSAAGFGGVSVTTRYAGVRAPDHLAVEMYAGINCDSVAVPLPIWSGTLPPSGGTVTVDAIGAGQVVSVWGSAVGAGGVLSHSCVDGLTIVRGQTLQTTLAFADLPLHVEGAYGLGLQLDLGVLPRTASDAWVRAAASVVAPAGDEATYLLNAVGDSVRATAGESAAAAYSRSLSDGLLTDVQADLTRRAASPLAALRRLATDSAAAIQGVDATGLLIATPRSDGAANLRIATLSYTIDPLTPDVSRDDVAFDVATTVTDGGDATVLDGDRVSVTLRSTPMPFATLARRATDALLARVGVASTDELLRLTVNCSALATLIVPDSGSCGQSCVETACEAAVDRLASAYDVAVSSIGSTHTSAQLGFEAAAQGRPGTLLLVGSERAAVSGVYVDDSTLAVRGVGWITAQ